MVGYFALCVPAGLSLYYMANTVFTGLMQARGRARARARVPGTAHARRAWRVAHRGRGALPSSSLK